MAASTVSRLETVVGGALQTPAVQARFAAHGAEPVGSPQQALRAPTQAEIL